MGHAVLHFSSDNRDLDRSIDLQIVINTCTYSFETDHLPYHGKYLHFRPGHDVLIGLKALVFILLFLGGQL